MDIIPLTLSEQTSVCALYAAVRRDLRQNGIYQWDRFYPNRFVIRRDLKEGHTFGLKQNGVVVGAVVLDGKQSSRYSTVNWLDSNGKAACIHRLAVHPDLQGKGLGKRLLQYAEDCALAQGYSSVRLDVYSGNPAAVAMYQRHGYEQRGIVHFPMRKLPYFCFEKVLVPTYSSFANGAGDTQSAPCPDAGPAPTVPFIFPLQSFE